MDFEYVSRQLEDLLSFRENQLAEMQELSCFSEEDAASRMSANADLSACIEDLKRQDDFKSQLQYMAADFANYRRRTREKESDIERFARKKTICRFLAVYDDLERAVNDAGRPAQADMETSEGRIAAGVKIVFENFEKLLRSEGCSRVECAPGDEFDVEVMEAVAARDCAEGCGYGPGEVAEVYASGWTLDGEVVRPAKVIVGRQKEADGQ